MSNEKYESPDIQVVSMEPDENLMDIPGTSPGVEPFDSMKTIIHFNKGQLN